MEQINAVNALTQQFTVTADTQQYLTFTLGNEEYGVPILTVQEIKGYIPATPIPHTPAYINGVMDLRGVIMPVIDLRVKFGMPSAEYDQFTVIIVVKVKNKMLGLVVDAVSDVLSVKSGELQATPEFGGQVDTRFIQGLAKAGDKLVVLLDLDRVLSEEEFTTVSAVAELEAASA
ncbi:MAG: purine-binding chemotaxis protein CheW [Deltaproteobacteria bacterium]|nr:purine-binding chemotaxis protein CheW [Deltaproteobacteria bacterium]